MKYDSKIFIRFTIKGDDLNLSEICADIPVPADVFVKGETILPKLRLKKYEPKPQKTNRWVYSIESEKSENINALLKRMYMDLKASLPYIEQYTKMHSSLLDIVVYVNSPEPMYKYNVNLSKNSLKIIDKLNSKMSFTVFDW